MEERIVLLTAEDVKINGVQGRVDVNIFKLD